MINDVDRKIIKTTKEIIIEKQNASRLKLCCILILVIIFLACIDYILTTFT